MSELSAWRQVTAIGPPQPHLASSPVSQPCLEDTSVAADIAYGIRSSDLSSTGHRVPVGGSDSLPHEELEIREQSVIDFNYAAVQDEVERKVRRRVGFPARLGRGTVPPELPVDEDEDLIFTKDQEKFTSWHCKYLAEKSLDITERGAGGNANVYAEIVTSQSWAAMSAALKMGGQSLLGLSIKDMPMARRIVVPVMTADGVEHTRPVKTGELEDVLMGFAEVMDEEPFDHLPVPLLPTSTLLSDRIDLWKKGQSAHFKIVPGAPRSNRAVEPDVAGKSQGSLDLGFGVIAIDGVAVGLKGGYRQLRQVYGEPETRERDDVTYVARLLGNAVCDRVPHPDLADSSFTLVTLMDNVALALHIVQGTEIHLEPASFHALRRLFDLLFRLLVVNMCTDIPIYTHFGMYTLGIVYLRKLGASAATNHALEYEAGQTIWRLLLGASISAIMAHAHDRHQVTPDGRRLNEWFQRGWAGDACARVECTYRLFDSLLVDEDHEEWEELAILRYRFTSWTSFARSGNNLFKMLNDGRKVLHCCLDALLQKEFHGQLQAVYLLTCECGHVGCKLGNSRRTLA